ncbi:type II toxin-antitoxin system RelE/ParE family toxin [Streptomyces uncialis]|uniref:type II toxin-antitoxin system RelE family toxin n=1 Tax=Streptomyces uncialis TaxID=1048205 RepID=UPI0038298FB6
MIRLDPAQFDGHVRRGPVHTLSIRDASRQLDAVTRNVAQAPEDLARREENGRFPVLDAEQALTFARAADSLSLTDYGGGKYRIHVGRYRAWYTITQNKPVVIAIDLVGRVR